MVRLRAPSSSRQTWTARAQTAVIAAKAEVPFAELYVAADSKRGVLAHLSARFDRAALGVDYAESAPVHDRLFDAAELRLGAKKQAVVRITRTDDGASQSDRRRRS